MFYVPRRDEVKTRANATGATKHMDYREVLDEGLGNNGTANRLKLIFFEIRA
jgi:hypothetical protein